MLFGSNKEDVLIGYGGRFFRIPWDTLKTFEVKDPGERTKISSAIGSAKWGKAPQWFRPFPNDLVAGVRG